MVGILLRFKNIQWEKSTNEYCYFQRHPHTAHTIHSFLLRMWLFVVCLFICTFKSRQPSHHRLNKKFVSYLFEYSCVSKTLDSITRKISTIHPSIHSKRRKSSRSFEKDRKIHANFSSTIELRVYNLKAMSQSFD